MSKQIASKLVKIRQDVGAVEKTAQGYGYTYQSADEVFTVVRTALNKHNVVFLPSMTHVSDSKGSWIVEFNMRWVDADSGETFDEPWAMTIPIADSKDRIDDKAMGKAGTYAVRYYLLRTLLITTREDVMSDIDAGDPNNLPVAQSQASQDEPAYTTYTVVVNEIKVEQDVNNKLWLVARPEGKVIAIPSRSYFTEAGWDTSDWQHVGVPIALDPPAEILFNFNGERCEFVAVDQFVGE